MEPLPGRQYTLVRSAPTCARAAAAAGRAWRALHGSIDIRGGWLWKLMLLAGCGCERCACAEMGRAGLLARRAAAHLWVVHDGAVLAQEVVARLVHAHLREHVAARANVRE